MRKEVSEGDLIQVNEDGPAHWFRCILVVDTVKSWGVQAYCTIPKARGEPAGDVFMRLEWQEFDTLGVKSKFVVAPTMDLFEEGEAR
jgi:hypothetical protein